MKEKRVKAIEEETTISEGLYATDGEALYDEACKRLLSEKQILARIMKACMKEYQNCSVDDIAEKYIEGQPQPSAEPVFPDKPNSIITGMDTEDKSRREHTVYYDIRFRSLLPNSKENVGIIINVEAQNNFHLN